MDVMNQDGTERNMMGADNNTYGVGDKDKLVVFGERVGVEDGVFTNPENLCEFVVVGGHELRRRRDRAQLHVLVNILNVLVCLLPSLKLCCYAQLLEARLEIKLLRFRTVCIDCVVLVSILFKLTKMRAKQFTQTTELSSAAVLQAKTESQASSLLW